MSDRAKEGRADKVIPHAFISYVHDDAGRVDRLQRRLESAGVRVWRDTADLWPGEDWRAKIRQAIRSNALVFIACFSQKSIARSRSYQNEELMLAIEELKLRSPNVPWLLPVRFDECNIPEHDIGGGRTLTWLHRVDLFGDHEGEGLDRLVMLIQRLLPPVTEVSTPATSNYAVTPLAKPVAEPVAEQDKNNNAMRVIQAVR